MRLIRDILPAPAERPETALAIGNFDGFHRGHQALIRAVCARSDEHTPALMCFEPLPASFFRPDQPVPRLLGVRDRLILCRGYGLDLLFMPRFDRAFAALSPEAFAARVIVGCARARHVVVGSDFRFGARAAGDVGRLAALGRQLGFELEVIEPVCVDGERVSSTRLRERLAAGDLAAVRALTGRAVAQSGRVLRGQQLGRQLGFPTINLLPPEPPALRGVFAVRVSGAGLDRHPGVASLGLRPTVAGRNWLLEAHLFDYDGDLYGRHLSVEFVAYLRAEEKFASMEAMRLQMIRDAERARGLLSACAA